MLCNNLTLEKGMRVEIAIFGNNERILHLSQLS